MAENKDVVFNTEVKGVEQSIGSLKDLKNAIKAAKDEQLKAAQAFGEGSKEFQAASKQVAELKDKMDDLNDSSQSLKGSGVEGLTSSFGLLGDGIKNFDFDKIKTGFKGIGSAMSAVPIFLLITGITLLVEKFGIIEKVIDLVVDAFYALTDAIGITHHAAEEQSKATILGLQDQQKAVEERYNAEIKLAKATGKDVSGIEIEKLRAVEASTFNQLTALKVLAEKKHGLNEDEKKEYSDLQSQLLIIQTDKHVKEIEAEKAKNEQLKKSGIDFLNATSTAENDLRRQGLTDRQREIEDVQLKTQQKIEELNKLGSANVANEAAYKKLKDAEIALNEFNANEIAKINKKYYDIDQANHQKLIDEKKKQRADEALALEQFQFDSEARKKAFTENAKAENDLANQESLRIKTDEISEQDLQRILKARKDKEQRDKDDAEEQAARDNRYLRTKQALTAAQQLTDIYFIYQLNKNKGNAAAELEIRKKQFNVNKAFGIVNATIDGVSAVQKALNNPYPLNIFLAAISGIAAAANIAKIASTKFDGGGASGGGGGGAASAPNIPSAPTISTQQNNLNNTGTQFDNQGNKIDPNNPQTVNVNATIGVDEVTSTQTRVQTIETRARF